LPRTRKGGGRLDGPADAPARSVQTLSKSGLGNPRDARFVYLAVRAALRATRAVSVASLTTWTPRHSRNIAGAPEIDLMIFDSTVPIDPTLDRRARAGIVRIDDKYR
jgi:hypothetical protein